MDKILEEPNVMNEDDKIPQQPDFVIFSTRHATPAPQHTAFPPPPPARATPSREGFLGLNPVTRIRTVLTSDQETSQQLAGMIDGRHPCTRRKKKGMMKSKSFALIAEILLCTRKLTNPLVIEI